MYICTYIQTICTVGTYRAYVGTYGAYIGTYGAYVGTYGAYVGTYGAYVGTYGAYIGTYGAYVGTYAPVGASPVHKVVVLPSPLLAELQVHVSNGCPVRLVEGKQSVPPQLPSTKV